ncbi:mitotic spindle checkpoint protein Bub3 [Tieghemiomyces parasiticus]|uniref:Mitotic spindle checkpoint protein Bub3 n=1 Tax=Tieghemiomyces parasiticus TaxID=78921 RepID=A0A9W8DPC2_9FUNG|nr:mitotic spindle checkpoint protein Bub3 [Tieghemiomyces parasiticus]
MSKTTKGAEYTLPDAPSDGISTVRFSPTEPGRLLATSWDTTLRLYDVERPALLGKYETSAAVLDACYMGSNPKRVFSVGLDPAVRGWDLETRTQVTLGSHEGPVRCVRYSDLHGVAVTGSWDKTVGIWDPRSTAVQPVGRIDVGSGDNDGSATVIGAWAKSDPAPGSVTDPVTQYGRYMQPERIFSLDIVGHIAVVAMAERHIYLYDLRNMKETLQRRESSLKYMTRCVSCMPNGKGYVCSSIEGRIAVEFIDPDPAVQANKYAFKCHRRQAEGVDVVYPVNALAFHPTYGTFASGGSDGMVYTWDGANKKRLRSYPRHPSSVSSLDFNCNGSLLAVASSYTFDEGEKDHPEDAIYIHPIGPEEAKPKKVEPKA